MKDSRPLHTIVTKIENRSLTRFFARAPDDHNLFALLFGRTFEANSIKVYVMFLKAYNGIVDSESTYFTIKS